ncbi:MAG: DUF952 domain-containing protein [Caulobacter sp.]|nr:DUF952 domain-containing protein [Caulobacter sp.]
MSTPRLIYHLCRAEDWRTAGADGYDGSPAARADGFLHLSTATQVEESAARHFAGVQPLMLVTVEAAALGEGLRWEPSRRGQLFPHLYGPLPLTAVVGVAELTLDREGAHNFPVLED